MPFSLLPYLLYQMLRRPLQGMGYPHTDSLSQRRFRGQQLDRIDFLLFCLCIRDARSGPLRGNNSLQQCAPKARGSGIEEAGIHHVILLRF